MAKQQTFADKANKLGKKNDLMAMCPDTNKETKIINVRMVDAIKTDKGTYKFLDRNMKVYESTYKPYKP
ncbi:MAG: hypothetical protein WBQ38_01590 [Ignavibacteria bacterium]|jgi:hypothetical protein|nr:hypothetical protein [Ignavibacteria bacterium]MBK7157342.1 hypothetical protein [Ignavibacteria bacterium]MBK7255030.1 hypothetical protein [Ignavibacteria bacterium]MBK7446773.1 hypothetical protein [Ignavibacteria bacterium]MBK8380954.1 hypothetical protein [Ignavibacteria bacterium]